MNITSTATIKGMMIKDIKLAHILGIKNLNTIYLFNKSSPPDSNLSGNTCVYGDIAMYINLWR